MRSDPEQKLDAEKLLGSARTFAERMLREFGEFHPYGEVMRPDGKIVSVSSTTGEEWPAAKDLISILRASYRSDAEAGKILVCAIVYDVKVVPPGSKQKKDAVAFAIDHRDGYSAEVFFPYVLRESREIVFDPPFAQKGSDEIVRKKG